MSAPTPTFQSLPPRTRPRGAGAMGLVVGTGALLLLGVLLGASWGCSVAPPQAAIAGEAEGEAARFESDAPVFEARAAEALRDRGLRVAWSTEARVQSRPHPVPSLLEPWASGPSAGAALASTATLGEVRQVATLRRSAGGEVNAEVWLERAHRPERRLVVRADGGVFSTLDATGALGFAGSAVPDRDVFDDGFAGDPSLEGSGDLSPGTAADEARPGGFEGGGLRWDRWRRSPVAEAELLAAWDLTER